MALTQEQKETLRNYLPSIGVEPSGDPAADVTKAAEVLVTIMNEGAKKEAEDEKDPDKKPELIEFDGNVDQAFIAELEQKVDAFYKKNKAAIDTAKLTGTTDFLVGSKLKEIEGQNTGDQIPDVLEQNPALFITLLENRTEIFDAMKAGVSDPQPAAAAPPNDPTVSTQTPAPPQASQTPAEPQDPQQQPQQGGSLRSTPGAGDEPARQKPGAPSTPTGSENPDMTTEDAVAVAETILSKLNEELSGKGFDVAQLKDPDTELDDNTKMALQSALVAISSPAVLDIPEGMKGLYTPEIGEQIRTKLKDPEVLERLGPAAKAQLKPEMVDGFILALNTLHKDKKIGQELLIDPDKVSPMNFGLIGIAAQLIVSFFPGLKQYIDPLLEQYTGKTVDQWAASAPDMDGNPIGAFLQNTVGISPPSSPQPSSDPDAEPVFETYDGPDLSDAERDAIAEEQDKILQQANLDIRRVQNSSLMHQPNIGADGQVQWVDKDTMREIEHLQYKIDGANNNIARRLDMVSQYEERIADLKSDIAEGTERNATDLVADYKNQLREMEVKRDQAIEHYNALRYGEEYTSYFDELEELTDDMVHTADISHAMRALEYMSPQEREETLSKAHRGVEGYQDFKPVADICAAYYGPGRLNDYFENVLSKRFDHAAQQGHEIEFLQDPSRRTQRRHRKLEDRREKLEEAEENLNEAKEAYEKVPDHLKDVSDEKEALAKAQKQYDKAERRYKRMEEKYERSYEKDAGKQEGRFKEWENQRRQEEYEKYKQSPGGDNAEISGPRSRRLSFNAEDTANGGAATLAYDPASRNLNVRNGAGYTVRNTTLDPDNNAAHKAFTDRLAAVDGMRRDPSSDPDNQAAAGNIAMEAFGEFEAADRIARVDATRNDAASLKDELTNPYEDVPGLSKKVDLSTTA